MIAKVRDPPSDKYMAGVEKIDQAGEHIADHLPAFTDNIQRSLISLPARCVDIFGTENATVRIPHLAQYRTGPVSSSFDCLGGDCRARSHRFQTALISASTQRAFFIYTDMTDVASAAITATMDFSVGNDTG